MADVSRETGALPAPPELVGRVIPPDRSPLLQQYALSLAGDGVLRGLIGPREVPRLWERHLLNSAALARLLPAGGTVADLGSGAGLPGLVLAIARPDVTVTLVEPLLRRTTYLQEVVAQLELEDQVEVVRGRAEALHGQRRFEAVTARAVAPLDRLLGWSMPLVAPAGALLAMKGSRAEEEIAAAADELARLRCAAPEVLVVGEDLPGATTTIVRVAWADPAAVGWPRARSVTPSRERRSGRSRRGPSQRDGK